MVNNQIYKNNSKKQITCGTESEEQQALFAWAQFMRGQHAELDLLHHIPNGGHRHAAVAARLKSEGVKAGVPDICLPIARGIYHGLYIELKAGLNKPTTRQLWWIEKLQFYGYRAEVAWGWQQAAEIITRYLNLQKGGCNFEQANQ